MLVRGEGGGGASQRQRVPRRRGRGAIGVMAGSVGDAREPAALAGGGGGLLRFAPIEPFEGEVRRSQIGGGAGSVWAGWCGTVSWCNAGRDWVLTSRPRARQQEEVDVESAVSRGRDGRCEELTRRPGCRCRIWRRGTSTPFFFCGVRVLASVEMGGGRA